MNDCKWTAWKQHTFALLPYVVGCQIGVAQ
jgi:hypothetical protein